MSAYAENKNLKGFTNWFTVQAHEEVDHAMGLYNHLVECGAKITLQTLPQLQNNYKDIITTVVKTLEHEKFITHEINSLYELANTEKDYALANFL
jgi:ferritin